MNREEAERPVMEKGYIGDRRAHVRFQVVGTMPVTLSTTEKLEMLNLGTNGALVEGVLPLPINAEYRVQLVLEGHTSLATMKVRRVAPITDGPTARYRMGVEFLALSQDAEDVFTRIVSNVDPGVDAQ